MFFGTLKQYKNRTFEKKLYGFFNSPFHLTVLNFVRFDK